MKDKKMWLFAGLDSLGTFVYVFVVAWFMANAENIFGKKIGQMYSGAMILLLLVISVLVTGFLVFGRPIILFINNKRRESIYLLIATNICLFVILLLTVLIFGWIIKK